MKKSIIIILSFYFVLLVGCKMEKKTIDKNFNYEELALKYFNDSIYNSKNFTLKGKKMFFDGIVTGCSIYSHSPFEMYHTRKYSMAVELQKSHLNNNAKDFYIKIPDKIKRISFEEFKKINNDSNYFLNVKHYIKSKKKIFIVIDFINQKGVTNNINMFLNLNGSITEWEEEVTIFFPMPRK